MKTYKVRMMSENDYADMMNGGYHYKKAEEFFIEAKNAIRALNKAKELHPDLLVISPNLKEMEEWAEIEKRNADEKGMTFFEYQKYKKQEATKAHSQAVLEQLYKYLDKNNIIHECDYIASCVSYLKEKNIDFPREKIFYDVRSAITATENNIRKLEEKLKELEHLKELLS